MLQAYRSLSRELQLDSNLDIKEYMATYVHNDVYGVQHYMAHLEIINSCKQSPQNLTNSDYLNFGNLTIKSELSSIENSS